MPARVLFRRAVLPHLALAPFLLAWRLAAEWNPPPVLWWVPEAAGGSVVAILIAVWVVSGVAVGKPMLGVFLPADWRSVRAWWLRFTAPTRRSDAGEAAGDCLSVLLLLILLGVGSSCCGVLRGVWQSPVWFCLSVQALDLAALAVALARVGALRPDQAAAARRAAAADRAAALGALKAFYREHASQLREAYPEARFRAELRVRVLPMPTPHRTWHAVRGMLAELQEAVRRVRQREAQRVEAHPPSAVRDRSRELRALIGQLDAQIRQTETAIRGGVEHGVNTAFLERQLADLRRRWLEAANELDRLARTQSSTSPG